MLIYLFIYLLEVEDYFFETKLDSEINSPFHNNEHGGPRFFHVFAKNSLIKNVFEEEKKA